MPFRFWKMSREIWKKFNQDHVDMVKQQQIFFPLMVGTELKGFYKSMLDQQSIAKLYPHPYLFCFDFETQSH